MQEYRLHDGRKVKARRRLQKPNARMRRQVSGKLWLERDRELQVIFPFYQSQYHVIIYMFLIGTIDYYLQHLRVRQTIY
jgi:hypothetical protein